MRRSCCGAGAEFRGGRCDLRCNYARVRVEVLWSSGAGSELQATSDCDFVETAIVRFHVLDSGVNCCRCVVFFRTIAGLKIFDVERFESFGVMTHGGKTAKAYE